MFKTLKGLLKLFPWPEVPSEQGRNRGFGFLRLSDDEHLEEFIKAAHGPPGGIRKAFARLSSSLGMFFCFETSRNGPKAPYNMAKIGPNEAFFRPFSVEVPARGPRLDREALFDGGGGQRPGALRDAPGPGHHRAVAAVAAQRLRRGALRGEGGERRLRAHRLRGGPAFKRCALINVK